MGNSKANVRRNTSTTRIWKMGEGMKHYTIKSMKHHMIICDMSNFMGTSPEHWKSLYDFLNCGSVCAIDKTGTLPVHLLFLRGTFHPQLVDKLRVFCDRFDIKHDFIMPTQLLQSVMDLT